MLKLHLQGNVGVTVQSVFLSCRGDCAKCVFVKSKMTSLVLDLHYETCSCTDDVCMYRLKFGGAIHLWSTFTMLCPPLRMHNGDLLLTAKSI